MKLKDIVPVYIDYKSRMVRPSTVSAYHYSFRKHLIPYFGNFSKINSDDVQKFIFHKIEKEKLSRGTVKDLVICLTTCLKWADKNNYFKYQKFEIEYPGNITRAKIEIYTKEQSEILQDFLLKNLTFRNIGILISLHTGMRIGEVCGLRYSDIDLNKRIVSVNRSVNRISGIEKGKTRSFIYIGDPKSQTSRRDIPLSETLYNIFFKIIPCLNNLSNFIVTNKEKPIEPRILRTWYKSVQNHLKIPSIKFHGMRHTFASRLLQNKIDVKTVSNLLGHSNASTTLNIYVHTNLEQKKSAIHDVF